VTTAVAAPAPGSCRWGDGNGRTMETSAMEDPRSGDIGAS
jgi:hypothetical protein